MRIVQDQIDAYLKTLVARSKTTCERVRYALQAFKQSEIEVNEQALERFFLWRCETVKTSTAITDVAELKGFLRFLHRRDIVSINLDCADEYYQHVRPRMHATSPEIDPHVDSLLQALRPRKLTGATYRSWLRDKALISLLLYSGLRRSEAASLTSDQVEDDELVVQGKGGKERIIFIHPHTRERLTQYLATRTDDNPRLFVSHARGKEGQPLSLRGMSWVIRQRANEKGIDAHPHTLRHAYARRMLTNNVPLHITQELLGHASPNTTKQIYGRMSNETLRKEVSMGWGLTKR